MIRTDASSEYNGGDIGIDVQTNAKGGHIIKKNQPGFVASDGTEAQKRAAETSYNVSYGSTSPQAGRVLLNIAQLSKVGISTSGLAPGTKKKVETNIPQKNLNTVKLYEFDRSKMFFELYERADDRKARHKALRDAGYQPPFPRADKFQKNIHQGNYVRAGVTTEGSYTP